MYTYDSDVMYILVLYMSIGYCLCCVIFVFFFKQKTAYEMRISDWSSDVCSSDLHHMRARRRRRIVGQHPAHPPDQPLGRKADRPQRAEEQAVLLEAIAAAPLANQLRIDRVGANVDSGAGQRVDRLKRNGRDMRGLERGEHIPCRRHRAEIGRAHV